MTDYEKDIEEAVAIKALEEMRDKARSRMEAHDALLEFLNSHPDFKTFYELLKAKDRY